MGAVAVLVAGATAVAGPFAPAAGQAGSTAVSRTDPRIAGWATNVVSLTRGPLDVADPSLGNASFGSAGTLTQPFAGGVFDVVSLGDGGSVTLAFDTPLRNGPGFDLAVFENGFPAGSGGLGFLELAFVEVSSDGANFVRFPSVSLTPADFDEDQVGGFEAMDPTEIHNLAGKYTLGFGTPFELDDVAGDPRLDLFNVRFVRVIDVVGRITPAAGFVPSLDSTGYVINDPYPTPFGTGGFDLGGVAGLNLFHTIPEPGSVVLLAAAAGLVQRPLRRKC